jgi:hypothetical protein
MWVIFNGAFVRAACAIATALSVFLHSVTDAEQPRPKVPVLVGGEESAEGCAGTSTVAVREGSTLNVRTGPGTSHPIIAHLPRGQSVSVCQRLPNGWVGIVVHRYPPGVRDCGLSDAGPKPQAYAGPCDSGWVWEKYLRLHAG